MPARQRRAGAFGGQAVGSLGRMAVAPVFRLNYVSRQREPQFMPEAVAACRCAKLPPVVLGTTTKLPTKRAAVLGSKPHPANPFQGFGAERTWVALVRCEACGQLWQADAWPRKRVGWTSWPDLCVKVETQQGWKDTDDRITRLAYFPEMVNGVSTQRCATPKCGDMAVNGLSVCANCACKTRDATRPGAWSTSLNKPRTLALSSGRVVPIKALAALLSNDAVAGIKAFREAVPNGSIQEARDAFAELTAQWQHADG
jgi:hypothetical protein